MQNIAPALLEWFYRNQRILPFRTDPSPYHVWLSEIMLQQTRVSAALPYYERFLAALPDIPALATCEEEKLHKLWEGLGYYSRVRNLQKAARIVCEEYGGELPADYDALRALPGIGDYTAGAIASISFGLTVPAVDGNVLRVFSRLYNDPGIITEPGVKKAFTARVMEHQPPEKAGDYNQALMELGALVCLPNGAPLCGQCPLAALCAARAAGTALELPRKAAPKARRVEPVTVVLAENAEGRFLLQQRPGKGLLAGLWQPLLWEGEALSAGEVLARLEGLGLGCAGAEALPEAKHIFSLRVADEGICRPRRHSLCPGRLRLGQPGTDAGRIHPARRIQCLQKADGALKKQNFAFLVVIFAQYGYNSCRIDRVCAAE